MTNSNNREAFRHLIEPFSFVNGDPGFLLLHGFTGSPSEMRPLGNFLSDKGYSVRCPLLPGHGTSMEDLEKRKWQDWYNAAETEWKDMAVKHDKVFVIGLSMGGVIALHLAEHHNVDGIIALAAGVKLKDWRISALPVLRHFVKRVKKTRNAYARGPDRKRFAYEYNSSKATQQIVRLYDHIKNDLNKVTAPLLMINSTKDRTTPFENTEIVMSRIKSSWKKVIPLNMDDHIITLSKEQDFIHKNIEEFISEHL